MVRCHPAWSHPRRWSMRVTAETRAAVTCPSGSLCTETWNLPPLRGHRSTQVEPASRGAWGRFGRETRPRWRRLRFVDLRPDPAVLVTSSSRSQRAMWPTSALTLLDLRRTVRGRPLASAGVNRRCYSVGYSPAPGRRQLLIRSGLTVFLWSCSSCSALARMAWSSPGSSRRSGRTRPSHNGRPGRRRHRRTGCCSCPKFPPATCHGPPHRSNTPAGCAARTDRRDLFFPGCISGLKSQNSLVRVASRNSHLRSLAYRFSYDPIFRWSYASALILYHVG